MPPTLIQDQIREITPGREPKHNNKQLKIVLVTSPSMSTAVSPTRIFSATWYPSRANMLKIIRLAPLHSLTQTSCWTRFAFSSAASDPVASVKRQADKCGKNCQIYIKVSPWNCTIVPLSQRKKGLYLPKITSMKIIKRLDANSCVRTYESNVQ